MRGQKVPSFFELKMISKAKIQGLIKGELEQKKCFVVGLEVASGNNIQLEIDSDKGVTIKDCVDFSRAVEHNLDREVEDFELHVSSPGLDKPFKVKEQYYKNVGRDVKVLTMDGREVKGELKDVMDENIEVEYSVKEKIEGRKKKQIIIKKEVLSFDNIKETTIVISFNK